MRMWLENVLGIESQGDVIALSYYLLLIIVMGAYIWREYRNRKLGRRSELSRNLRFFKNKTSRYFIIFMVIVLTAISYLADNFISARI